MAIGGKYDDVASNNEAYRIISNIQMFRGLGTKRLFALVKSLRIVDYEAGDIIFEKGVSGDTFYIIKEGEVDIVIDERIIRTFGQFEYFGERSVLFNQVRTATVKARTNIVLWELQQARFQKITNESVRKAMLRRIEIQDEQVTLSDLLVHKTLGKGLFGVVFLVSH